MTKVRAAIASGLAKLKSQSGGGSSAHATRALLLAEPASVDGGEITDKGYINQRAVLTRRASAVKLLEDDVSGEWIGCALRRMRVHPSRRRFAPPQDEVRGLMVRSAATPRVSNHAPRCPTARPCCCLA